MLRAAATEVCITPPVGVELAGYYRPAGRPSADIQDHLTAQALVLDDGESRVALVTSDLLALSAPFVEQVRREIYTRAGIPPAHVMVSCAHIHTAPTTTSMYGLGEADDVYVHMAARHIAGAVVASAGRLQPARLSAGHGEHTGLAWHRLGWEDTNPAIEVVRIDGAEGRPLALMVNYACHPVILGPTRAISADYPGALRRALQDHYPVVLFANSAAGDIDPITNRDVWGQGTFDDVERLGVALAEDARQAAARANPLDGVRLQVRREALRLDLAVPTLEDVRARIAQHRAEADALGAHAEDFEAPAGDVKMPRFWLNYYRRLEQKLLENRQPDHVSIELQALIVSEGTLAMLAVPGELFTAEGRAIRAASPHDHTCLVCYANGAFGYFPPRSQFEEGAYAAKLAAAAHDFPPYRPDVAEHIVEAAVDLLK